MHRTDVKTRNKKKQKKKQKKNKKQNKTKTKIPTPMQKPKNKNSTRMNLTYKFSNITKILRSLHICFILPWWVFVRYQSLCFTNVPYNFGMSILVLFICFHVGFLILLCYKYTTMNHKTLHL